jgi:hypothetical protein
MTPIGPFGVPCLLPGPSLQSLVSITDPPEVPVLVSQSPGIRNPNGVRFG